MMKVNHPIPIWIGLVIFLIASPIVKVSSQCNPPEQLPTVDCQSAPLVCLLNACYETLNESGTGPSNWCGGSTSIQNPQYFQIIPTAPNITIHIHVDFCENGTSLQSAIIGACPWAVSDVLACNAGTPAGGTMVLSASGLVPGQVYWLMIDGFSGAFCNYTITFTENIFSPGLNEELESAEAMPSSVCQGYNNLFLTAEPAIALAHGYYWVLGWNNDTVTSTLPNIVIDVPADLDPDTYEICVRAFSGCDTTDMDLCFEVEVYEIPPEEKDPEIFCPEEFPFSWGSVSITGAGDYEQSYEDADGCRFDSLWTVESYPEPELGQVDTLHCLPLGENTFYYEGDPYDQAGTYPLFYPNADINGCDSMAELNLVLIGVDAIIELTCENGEFVITSYIQELIPFSADVEYYWYEGGTQVAEGNPFATLQDGCYDLYIRVITPEGFCEFFIETFCFDADLYYPPPPVLSNMDTMLCAQEGVVFCVVPDPFGELGLEYVWSAPFNVPVFQDGSECVEMDFSNSSGGQICVYAIGACGAGTSTCFEVDIIPAPVATFSFDPNICINEVTTITFTGSASPGAEIIWDFNTPSTITGSGIGPYMVSWMSPGTKVVSLTVIEPGCDTATFSANIMVEQLTAPLINCTSTISSILFDWTDVAGASGYFVSIDGGPAVAVSSSDTLLSPLAPGTMVELILTVVSGGACPNLMDTMVCTAENCPPPLIILTGQDSACLNDPAIIDLEATVNGSPGTGTWSGPGIIDAMEGLFDPTVSGAGMHQLIYSVLENGCPFTEAFSITVFDSITADFTLDPSICISEQAHLQYTGNASSMGAMFSYDFGPAMVVSGTGVGPYELRWATPGLKTVRLQVEEHGCMSDVITRTTNVTALLTAPVVPCAPNTSGVVFTWTTDPAASGIAVNVLSGQTGTLNGNQYTFNGLNPGDIVSIEIVTMSMGPCPERRDTFDCEARECPMVMIDIEPVDYICLYPGTSPVDLEVTVTNGNGVGDWSGTGVTDIVNGVFDPVIAGSGSHLITYHYLDDGCDFYETITIDVYDVPEAIISNTDLVITCTSGAIFLDGSQSTGGPLNYQWTALEGVIDAGANTDIAEVSSPGMYQLMVSHVSSGCRDSVVVEVIQDDNIPTSKAGPDKMLTCDTMMYTLGGASSVGANIIYSWSTMSGNIVGPDDAMTVVADQPGTYTITVRDTMTGCESQDQVVLTMDTVVASIILMPGDTIDCNTTVTTATSQLDEPVIDYTFLWSTTDGKFQGDQTNPAVNVTQGGTYTLTIHNIRNGCEASEDVMIAESDEIIDDVIIDQQNVTCFGQQNGILNILSVDGGSPPYTFNWSVSPGGMMLSNLSPGTYGLTVSDGNGCTYTTSLTITEPDKVTVDVGPNQTVAAMDSVRIDLQANRSDGEISTIDWGGFDGLNCPGCPFIEFVAASSTTISAELIDTAGCRAIDSMRLTVIVPRIIFVPNVFSPNGDGVNDNFTISGRFNLINIASLQIFDRWGNEVFGGRDLTPGDESLGWDGTFNDEPMQPGVYTFVAQLDYEDISEGISGSITLIR